MKRSILSAIVAGALLAGVACSGGGGMSPNPVTKATMTTPNSVSPATVKSAPMVHTAIQSASAMTSRTPASAIEPQSWAQISGTATQVAASADGSLWALSDQPAGADKYIWHYASGTWTNIDGLASQIAVAPNGTLYAVNSSGGIYAYSGGSWTSPGGGATAIAALSDNSFVVISNAGTGDRGIWHFDGSAWKQIPGAGIFLAGGRDTTSHAVGGGTINPGGTYIVNTAGSIYYENTDQSFAQLPASASAVVSLPGGVFAVGATMIDAGGYGIYYYDLDNQGAGWTAQSGSVVELSIGAGNTLYAVTATGAIYETGTNTPAATPTPTPTSPPTATPTPGAALTVSPNPIELTQAGDAYITLTEAGFTGVINTDSSDSNIFTVPSSVMMTDGTATLAVNALTAGSATLIVSDGSQEVDVTVDVTITGVVISHSQARKP